MQPNPRAFLLSLWLIAVSLPVFAQGGVKGPAIKNEILTIQGTLRHMPWSKTGQSYCAGGSDYYILDSPAYGEVVLQGNLALLKGYENQLVFVYGGFEKKTIKADPMSQQPQTYNPMTGKSEPFSCQVFAFKEIAALEPGTEPSENIYGYLERRSQTKSIQSICAGADEYFVLVDSQGDEHLLEGQDFDTFAHFEGAYVRLMGVFYDVQVKLSSNPYEQKPIGLGGKPATHVSCTFFDVSDIILED